MKLYLERLLSAGVSDSRPGRLRCLHNDNIAISEISIIYPSIYSQLIQPKLQNITQKAPDTTSQASQPPSGKDFASCIPGLKGAFSISRCWNPSLASGMMNDGVPEAVGSGVGDSSYVSAIDKFSATVVDDVSEFNMAEEFSGALAKVFLDGDGKDKRRPEVLPLGLGLGFRLTEAR